MGNNNSKQMENEMKNNLFALSVVSSALLLAGCGEDVASLIEPENKAPSVSLTAERAYENQSVTITSTASDSDGSIASYQWKIASAHTLSLTNASSQSVSFVAPAVDVAGDTVTLELTVTDDDGATASANVNISVDNLLPSVSFEGLSVNERETGEVAAVVDATGDTIESYQWAVTQGGTDLVLTDATSANVSFTAPELDVNKTYELSLTVTDIDGDTATVTNEIAVNRITMPLTIAGLATDSPIKNARISVQVAGRDVTVDATADAEGNYVVELELDESEADAFVTVVAKGVDNQAVAGLITLLGSAGQLIEKAGEDGTLTSDEDFAVNVTNITTAEYALAKIANDGQDITSDEQLETLKQEINYAEVMTLATAIKVAIDKAVDNPDLALPATVTDTLALVESVEETTAYVAEVIQDEVFVEAQEEIYADEKLIDKSNTSGTPSVYYILPTSTLHRSTIARFNEDGKGTYWDNKFTWEEKEGSIFATVTEQEVGYGSEPTQDENGYNYSIDAEYSVDSYEFKRLNEGEKQDLIAITTTSRTHYPNGEKEDEVESQTSTFVAAKEASKVELSIESGVAYLPLSNPVDDVEDFYVYGEEVTLNSNGTARLTVLEEDGTWKIEDGELVINIPGMSRTMTYKKVGSRGSSELFSSEVVEHSNSGSELNVALDYVGEGQIIPAQMNWSASDVPGIYDYESDVFSQEHEHFFFQLHENGNAETVSTNDWDENGELEEHEIQIMYGTWSLNSDGTVTITRVREKGGLYTEECREVSDVCGLYHTRTWRLTGVEGDEYSLFHNHHFSYKNVWQNIDNNDYITYDNRKLYKRETAPVEYEQYMTQAQSSKKIIRSKKATVSKRFEKLEPSLD